MFPRIDEHIFSAGFFSISLGSNCMLARRRRVYVTVNVNDFISIFFRWKRCVAQSNFGGGGGRKFLLWPRLE